MKLVDAYGMGLHRRRFAGVWWDVRDDFASHRYSDDRDWTDWSIRGRRGTLHRTGAEDGLMAMFEVNSTRAQRALIRKAEAKGLRVRWGTGEVYVSGSIADLRPFAELCGFRPPPALRPEVLARKREAAARARARIGKSLTTGGSREAPPGISGAKARTLPLTGEPRSNSAEPPTSSGNLAGREGCLLAEPSAGESK